MAIQNDTLSKMLASATKLKEQDRSESREDDKKLSENLPVLENTNNNLVPTVSISSSLSLEPNQPITRQSVLDNVKVEDRVFKASKEEVEKARRKVGKLTTGASAAMPLICRGHSCPFSERCVSGDTMVMTPKGYKAISELKVRDIIYSYDTEYHLEKDTVLEVIATSDKDLFEIKTQCGFSLKITPDHPLLVVDINTGEKSYKSLKTGLGLLNTLLVVDDCEENDLLNSYSHGDLFEDIIVSIEYIGVDTVYDIRVTQNNTFIANGIASHNCPYFQIDPDAVIGKDCLPEVQLIEYWTAKYMDELQIDGNSISEMHSVSRLVEITIMDVRMTNYLSINDQHLMMEYITAVGPEGGAISNLGPSVAFDIKERLEKQKLKIMETLNNTREKKAKLVLDTDKNQALASNRQILEKLDNLVSMRVVNPTKTTDVDSYDIN